MCVSSIKLIIQFFFTIFSVTYVCIDAAITSMIPTVFRRKKSLSGEIALVTGAGSGIGRQLSIRLAKEGAKLVLWDIHPEGLVVTQQLIKKENGHIAHTYQCDVADRLAVYSTAELVRQKVGKVSVLVNNAGIVTGKRILEASDEDIQRTMAVNVTAHFWTIKAFLPDMIVSRKGHIVTVSSLAGKIGISQLVDYCTSKFGATGLHTSLSQELRNSGVQLTNICPYFINTGMFTGLESRFPSIFPGLDQHDVADRIIKAIQFNECEVVVPASFKLLIALQGLLPSNAVDILSDFFGFQNLMSTFIGRQGTGIIEPVEMDTVFR